MQPSVDEGPSSVFFKVTFSDCINCSLTCNYLEFSSNLYRCQHVEFQGGASAIQRSDIIQSQSYLIGTQTGTRHFIEWYLESLVSWAREHPIYIGVDWFGFHVNCRLAGSRTKALVGCAIHRLRQIKCGFVAVQVIVGLAFEVRDELIPLLFREGFLLDESHVEKVKRLWTASLIWLSLSAFSAAVRFG